MNYRQMLLLGALFVVTALLHGAHAVSHSGYTGQMGNIYTLGSAVPLYFSLKSAEYTITRQHFSNIDIVPGARVKLLVIHFSLQNPLRDPVRITRDTLRFTVEDTINMRYTAVDEIGVAETGQSLEMTLQPAQQVKLYAVFLLPATSNATTLTVLPQDAEGRLIQYPLQGKIQALPVAVADPADTTGTSTRDDVPMLPGAFFPSGVLDIRIDGIQLISNTGNNHPQTMARSLTINMSVKNMSASSFKIYPGALTAVLQMTNGPIACDNMQLVDGVNRANDLLLQPRQVTRIRLSFPIPDNVGLTKVFIHENTPLSQGKQENRQFTIDVSQVK